MLIGFITIVVVFWLILGIWEEAIHQQVFGSKTESESDPWLIGLMIILWGLIIAIFSVLWVKDIDLVVSFVHGTILLLISGFVISRLIKWIQSNKPKPKPKPSPKPSPKKRIPYIPLILFIISVISWAASLIMHPPS